MGIEGNGSLIVIWYLGSLHRCGKWILFDGQKRRTQTGRRTPAPFTREMQEMSNTNWEDQTHITRRAKAKKQKTKKQKHKTNKKETNFNPVWTFGDNKAKKRIKENVSFDELIIDRIG